MNSPTVAMFILMLLLIGVTQMLAGEPGCGPQMPPEDHQYTDDVARLLQTVKTMASVVPIKNSIIDIRRSNVTTVIARATCSTFTETDCPSCIASAVKAIKERCPNSKSASVSYEQCSVGYEPPQV